MDNPIMKRYIDKYRTDEGIMDLGKMLSQKDELGLTVTEHIHETYKRIPVIKLPNGMVFYAKPTDFRGVSAEKIVSDMYQRLGIISPDTTVSTMNGIYYAITNDVLPSHDTERGYKFLRNLTPAGEQFALPRIFAGETAEPKFLEKFIPFTLDQISLYYGLAYATGNWDANLCNLNFSFSGKTHDVATGIVSIDYERALDPGSGLREVAYSNPFEPKRIEAWQLMNHYRIQGKIRDFIKLGEIATKIETGANAIDEIVEISKEEGFVPDPEFVDNLKYSMHNAAEQFDRAQE